MHRVGLCMIVKNETHVIERCLRSVRDHIDHWVVVDTGSTDGTQELVRDLLAGTPGFLLERPWRDFGSNRSEALAVAREHAEYSFVIDADEEFLVPASFRWPMMGADSVQLLHRCGSMVYWRASLLANRLPWRYVGLLHEYVEAEDARTSVNLEGPQVVGHFDGGRSVGLSTVEKYARDARTLEAALAQEPDNPRYQYYLARSYRDSDRSEAALAAYRRRSEMGGFPEEVWDSRLWIARLLERQGGTDDEVIGAYLHAWETRPGRAEPLVDLARFCRLRERFVLGRAFAAQATLIPRPTDDVLWIEEHVYEWAALDEFAVSSYWAEHPQDAADSCRELLERRSLPASERDRVRANLDFAEAKLAATGPKLPTPRVPRPAQPVEPRSVACAQEAGPDKTVLPWAVAAGGPQRGTSTTPRG
jgi:glycosyltransferase involved in cell wall biosynthesis